jgi:hypothetical protein
LKLRQVEIHGGVDEFSLRRVERLNRLQDFDWQALTFADAAEISVVGTASRLDAGLGDRDARTRACASVTSRAIWSIT